MRYIIWGRENSGWEMYRNRSSAKAVILIVLSPIGTPWKVICDSIKRRIGSSARLKRMIERGHPCLLPQDIDIGEEIVIDN